MSGYGKNNILKFNKHVGNEPTESKHVKKIRRLAKRLLKGKRYDDFSENESFCIAEQPNRSARISKSSENYEKTVDRSSVASTIDSGVIVFRDKTPKKCQRKRLRFSPEIQVIEVDVEKYQSRERPQKCIVRITETAFPEKVDYRRVHTSTPQKPKEEITTAVLQSARLVSNRHYDPEVMLNLTLEGRRFLRSSRTISENRQSNRWKRRGICFTEDVLQALINSPEMLEQSEQPCRKIYSESWAEEEGLNKADSLLKLKKARYAECLKMTQTCNLLQIISESSQAEFIDGLLAEKILLETDEKCTLMISKFRDLGYTEMVPPEPCHVATGTLTNFTFFLEPQESRQSKFWDFYVISLSHGTEMLMSTIISPDEDNQLTFDESFTFSNLNSDFSITVKIFTIRLGSSGKTVFSLLGNKTKNLYPISKIYYENVHTSEISAASLSKTAFRCCGEFQLTKDNIGRTRFALSKIPVDSNLIPAVRCTLKIDNLRIYSKACGFLTLGLPNKQNEVLHWERKWCVLNGTRLSIYNCITGEDAGKPILTIDLENCLMPISKNWEGCPRGRNFLLKTGKPGACDNEMNVVLRRKSNFVVQKYFFASDDSAEFELWSSKLQSILDFLKNWRKLIFFDDYC